MTLVISGVFASSAFASDRTIDSTYKYAWADNVGWINFGTTQGNVHVTDSALTGYAWEENVGWISLNCSNDSSCGSNNYAVANNGSGTLSGYGWSDTAGWVNFNPTNGGVSINASSGEFTGYAWGENVGWISFNCSNDGFCGTNNYKVMTASGGAGSGGGIQVSSRSDTLSNSQPNATSNHSFAFTTNTQITGSSTITLTYPGSFTIPGTLNCGDVDVATSSQFNFNYPSCAATATAWGFSVSGPALILQAPTDSTSTVHVATGTPVTIEIGSNAVQQQTGTHWITNPSTPGVYTVSVGGTFGGSGNIPVSINSGQTVQATMAENLSFTASSVNAVNCTANDGATVNAITTTATSVPFGFLSSNAFYQGCQDLTVSTNALGGYSLTVQEKYAMQTANGLYSIPDTTCDAGLCTSVSSGTWVTPTKYGLGNTCWNVSGSDCNASFLNGTKFKPVPNVAAGTALGTISFVQANATKASSASQNSTSFNNPNTAGNLSVVFVDWSSSTNTVTSITDTQGNPYTSAVGPVNWGSSPVNRAQIFYAKNTKGGANTVTVTISDVAPGITVYVHEYAGADTVSPLDAVSSGYSSGTTMDSGSATTHYANELIFGGGFSFGAVQAQGAGFTSRSTFGSNMTEDKTVTAAGSYNATETNDNSYWVLLMATFKASLASPGTAFMSNSGPAVSTSRAKYCLSASPNQQAGTYSTVIMYTLTPTY